jgi:protein-tyrosine phosphatase
LIDLHSHILPGIDDGPASLAESVEMARAAVAGETRTIVATPHVNDRFRPDPEEIVRLAGSVNIELARAEIPLAVITGAEIAITRLAELDDEVLRVLALGSGLSVLVESPYERSARFIDEALFALQVRGFLPVLAHPERCPLFQDDIERLRALVDRGVLSSVNAGSLAGEFGSTVRRFALRLLQEGLVHDVASDAHDPVRRPPPLLPGFEAGEAALPGLSGYVDWLTQEAPASILRGKSPPPPPSDAPQLKMNLWRRLAGRV